MNEEDRKFMLAFLIMFLVAFIFIATVSECQKTERLKFSEHYVQVPVYTKSGAIYGLAWQREPVDCTFTIIPR